jgi:hypothetical protein
LARSWSAVSVLLARRPRRDSGKPAGAFFGGVAPVDRSQRQVRRKSDASATPSQRRDKMNSPEDIRAYQEAQREADRRFILWIAQVVVTPLLLMLILWRVW